MDPRKANESQDDPYTIGRDYSNPRPVGLPDRNPEDALDKEKPKGMGGDPMTEGSGPSLGINWFRGKQQRKQ